MTFTEDHIEELKRLSADARRVEEAGTTYFLIPHLKLPEGCTPQSTDVLLCPTANRGYIATLFFTEKVTARQGLNWQPAVRILERNWHWFSWKDIGSDLRPAQMIAAFFRALR